MHTKKRLRRSIALRSKRCARHCLTAASERHGLTMMSNKWGGVFFASLLPPGKTASTVPMKASPVLPPNVGQGVAAWRYVRGR